MIHNLEAVRAANDIVTVVGKYVQLKKSGLEWKGLCPFHADKRPSFSVNLEKQVYLCRACNARGDVFKFIQEIEHVNFVKAKAMLAARAGISVAPLTAVDKKAWAIAADERELIQHCGFVEGVSSERAGSAFRERCATDPEYRAWLQADLAHAHALAGILVGIIAVAQARDGDYPLEPAA